MTTDLESVRAYLPGKEAIFVPIGDTKAYVDSIRDLADDQRKREQMGSNARRRAEELSWHSSARQYERLYENVLSGVPAPSPTRRQLGAAKAAVLQVSAIRNETSGIAIQSRSIRTRHVSGKLALEYCDYAKAAFHFEACVNTIPDDYESLAGQAASAEARWKWSIATEQWQKVLRLAPAERAMEIKARIANCHVQRGDILAAKSIADDLRASFYGPATLARIAALSNQNEAGEYWSQCTIQYPEEINGFIGRAAHLIDRWKLDEAEKLLSHVVRVWPESAHASALWASNSGFFRDWETADMRWHAVLPRFGSNRAIREAYARYVGRRNALSGVGAEGMQQLSTFLDAGGGRTCVEYKDWQACRRCSPSACLRRSMDKRSSCAIATRSDFIVDVRQISAQGSGNATYGYAPRWRR